MAGGRQAPLSVQSHMTLPGGQAGSGGAAGGAQAVSQSAAQTEHSQSFCPEGQQASGVTQALPWTGHSAVPDGHWQSPLMQARPFEHGCGGQTPPQPSSPPHRPLQLGLHVQYAS